MAQWVWFDGSIALIKELDETTDFCEIQVMYRNPRRFQGKITWSLSDESCATSLSNTREMTEHSVHEIRDNVFIIDDGDDDYTPSSDESEAESEFDELEEEVY